jgi:hypothetical protein
MVQALFDRLLPHARSPRRAPAKPGRAARRQRLRPRAARADPRRPAQRAHRAGAEPAAGALEDRGCDPDDVTVLSAWLRRRWRQRRQVGMDALAQGAVAVVSLAGGAGSRWTKGAGVVKALNPFARFGGKHRNFIEVHLAKSRRISQLAGAALPHIFTTSHLTHTPVADHLARAQNYDYPGPLLLVAGAGGGLAPDADGARPALCLGGDAAAVARRAGAKGAGKPARRADPLGAAGGRRQRLHRQRADAVPAPGGHWYEAPNLLRNGVLARLLAERPVCAISSLHNIDTLGADVDPLVLGQHIARGKAMSVEVTTRRIDDRGGGLARVDGRLRLVEGLALPREEVEFAPHLLQLRHLLDRHRPDAGGIWPHPRRPDRRYAHGGGCARRGGAHAHLRHAQRCQEAVGQGAGGCLPRDAVREAVGRHDHAARVSLAAFWRFRACAASSSRKWRSSTAGCATARRPTWTPCAPGPTPDRAALQSVSMPRWSTISNEYSGRQASPLATRPSPLFSG